jgi:hypothetical protein
MIIFVSGLFLKANTRTGLQSLVIFLYLGIEEPFASSRYCRNMGRHQGYGCFDRSRWTVRKRKQHFFLLLQL